MRAELKIGIVVGLVIALVAVLYVVFHESQAPQSQELPQPRAELPPPTPAVPSRTVEPVKPDRLVPAFSGSKQVEPVVTELAEAPRPAPTSQPTVAAVPEETRATEPLAVRITAPTATTRPSAATVTPRPAPAVPTATPALRTTPITYVVQQGDKGFWGIAETVYGPGKGKHWPLIEKANPDVKSTQLKAGMVLTIPPLPSRVTTPAMTTPPATSTERVYIVQPDDGWWMISRKAYGDGKYWKQLRDANPHVEGMLKVGQKIRIPPLVDVRPTSPSGATESSTVEPSPDRPIFD